VPTGKMHGFPKGALAAVDSKSDFQQMKQSSVLPHL